MRKISKLLGLLSIPLAIGCGSTIQKPAVSQPTNHVDDTEYRIDELTYHTDANWSYGVPKGCVQGKTAVIGTTSISGEVFTCNTGLPAFAMLLLVVDRTNKNLDDYTAQTIQGFIAAQAQPLKTGMGKIDGNDASLVVFNYVDRPIIDYHFISLYDGKAFNFSCATLLPERKETVQLCKTVMRSIKIVR
jgi:hypothetical protein